MSPRARRILIPIVVTILALGVVASMIFSRARTRPAPAVGGGEADVPTVVEESGDQTPPEGPADGAASGEAAGEGAPPTPEPEQPASPAIEAADVDLTGLIAIAPDTGVSGHDTPTQPLGSLDPREARMQLQFSRAGAGLSSIPLAEVWETVAADRQARAYLTGKSATRPDELLRYILQEEKLLTRGAGFMVPAMAAHQVTINGQIVPVFDYPVVKTTDQNGDVKWEQLKDDAGNPVFHWAEIAPGEFQTEVVNAAGDPILRITRRFTLGENYDITIEQRLENLSGALLEVQWSQYGPDSLRMDRSRYMDRRRYRFGYLADPAIFPPGSPDANVVRANDNKVLMERSDVLKRWKKANEAGAAGDTVAQADYLTLWPNKRSKEQRYTLSWFGATNRYFALAVHPVLDEQGNGGHKLTGVVDRIQMEVSQTVNPATGAADETVFTYLVSPWHTIDPGEELALDIGVYAGPLDRHILGKEQPYIALSMSKLILYQMSSCCAICTFQWLAEGLLWFLAFLEDYIVFDWAMAIIILVIIVRILLHPLTKKSQVSMQRFGKAMGDLKPEIDKLQKKYGHDPKRMQQEQMKLMRERGVHFGQMLGCLPMFLQMPIWIALYAMLYFTFDLRQVPAFYGLFQVFWNWPFLADLSAADHCLGEFAQPFKFLMWNVTGINVLPILMGAIFFVQQKYMSPPPSPTMTKEQLSQQKMMKVMMVVMFPLMLYSAPSGLTLYILTSSTIGVLESRYIRRHIKEMDLNPPKKKPKRKTKPKDAQGRAYAAAMKRMEEKRRRKQLGPEKKYKKRK